MCACHPPGTATNQEWTQAAPGAALVSLAAADTCLQLSSGPVGVLSTTDSAGATWCLKGYNRHEGRWIGIPCSPADAQDYFTPIRRSNPGPGTGNYSIAPAFASSGGPGWNTQPLASGPWPHSRYVTYVDGVFTLDLDSPTTAIQADDTLTSEGARESRSCSSHVCNGEPMKAEHPLSTPIMQSSMTTSSAI